MQMPRVDPASEPPEGRRCAGFLTVQEASQRFASVVLGLLGHACIRYPIEAMIRSRIYVELDRHPGAAQSIRIDHVFFEEGIPKPKVLPICPEL